MHFLKPPSCFFYLILKLLAPLAPVLCRETLCDKAASHSCPWNLRQIALVNLEQYLHLVKINSLVYKSGERERESKFQHFSLVISNWLAAQRIVTFLATLSGRRLNQMHSVDCAWQLRLWYSEEHNISHWQIWAPEIWKKMPTKSAKLLREFQ